VAHVNALDPRPDVVLATGDLVEGGKPEEYARLRRLLAPLDMRSTSSAINRRRLPLTARRRMLR